MAECIMSESEKVLSDVSMAMYNQTVTNVP